jgi:hypothetical protein
LANNLASLRLADAPDLPAPSLTMLADNTPSTDTQPSSLTLQFARSLPQLVAFKTTGHYELADRSFFVAHKS